MGEDKHEIEHRRRGRLAAIAKAEADAVPPDADGHHWGALMNRFVRAERDRRTVVAGLAPLEAELGDVRRAAGKG